MEDKRKMIGILMIVLILVTLFSAISSNATSNTYVSKKLPLGGTLRLYVNLLPEELGTVTVMATDITGGQIYKIPLTPDGCFQQILPVDSNTFIRYYNVEAYHPEHGWDSLSGVLISSGPITSLQLFLT